MGLSSFPTEITTYSFREVATNLAPESISKEHRMVLNTGYAAIYVAPGYLLYLRDQTVVAHRFDRFSGLHGGELRSDVFRLANGDPRLLPRSQNRRWMGTALVRRCRPQDQFNWT